VSASADTPVIRKFCQHASRGWSLDKARARSPTRPMNLNRMAGDIGVGGLGSRLRVRWGSSVLHGRNHRGPPQHRPQRLCTYVIVLAMRIQFFWIHLSFKTLRTLEPCKEREKEVVYNPRTAQSSVKNAIPQPGIHIIIFWTNVLFA
jgi:hypothetical protein